MNAEFFEALELLEKTKGIPKDYMLERIEAALTNAFGKERDGKTNVRIAINEAKKDIKVYERRDVVETVEDPATQISLEEAKKLSRRYVLGSVVETEVKTKDWGRKAAHAAKQVVIQAVRTMESSKQAGAYDKVREDVIPARIVKVNDNTGDVTIDTGTSEIVLLKSEQIPKETLGYGDIVKVFVSEVIRNVDMPPIVTVSRSHPGLVKRLFEQEIPEIADGIVTIKGIAREAGDRTKISVMSNDPDVDAVGACIGNRGSRIQGIVDELNGEKIDVIAFSEIPGEYIAAALSPATVKEVEYDGEKSSKVTVDSDQLSLAIGIGGQNARLAAKLTGYKIDIKGTSI